MEEETEKVVVTTKEDATKVMSMRRDEIKNVDKKKPKKKGK